MTPQFRIPTTLLPPRSKDRIPPVDDPSRIPVNVRGTGIAIVVEIDGASRYVVGDNILEANSYLAALQREFGQTPTLLATFDRVDPWKVGTALNALVQDRDRLPLLRGIYDTVGNFSKYAKRI